MGIVKISEEIHDELRKSSKAFDRSLNSQAEHWIKIGMLAELGPSRSYVEIMELLLKHHELDISEILKMSQK